MTPIRRHIRAYPEDHAACSSCGKNTARRTGKAPAPITLIFGDITYPLCMKCAKTISDKLDIVIEHIEEQYL